MLKSKNCTRHQPRRQQERRSNSHPFNSPAWIATVQQHYLLWPKHDRRSIDRRSQDRRLIANHPQRVNHRLPSPANHWQSSHDVLTDDEKRMILQMFAEEA